MAEKVLDNVSLALIGGGALLIVAPGTVAPGNERLARLFGAGLALAGALRVLAAARDEASRVAAVVGAPIALAERAVDTVSGAGSIVLDSIERAAAEGLAQIVGPPAPPPESSVQAPAGELVPPIASAREPYLTTNVGIVAGALTAPVSAVLIDPPNGGELDISGLSRNFRGEVELRNRTNVERDPLLEYVLTVTPRSPFASARTVRGRLLDNAGKKPKPLKPNEVRRIAGAVFDLGGRDLGNVDVTLRMIVDNVQTQSTAFALV